jgi:ATP-dependent Clp protease ATP-binding subunit ClpC
MKDFDQFNSFTKEAKQALIVAQEKAKEAKLNYVGTEHVLIGILSQENSLGASILLNFGVSLENVYLVLNTVGRTQSIREVKEPEGLSGFAKQIIEDAVKIAHEYNHAYVGTEHLLFALVSQESTAATVILENMKVSAYDVKQQVVEIFNRAKQITNQKDGDKQPPQGNKYPGSAGANKNAPGMMNPIEFFINGLQGVMSAQQGKQAYNKKQPHQKGNKNSDTPALDYFSVDLTKEARKGKLDPIIGRDKEIERVVSILSRKTKNNPILIGESGVGKTAIAEGLAQAIA